MRLIKEHTEEVKYLVEEKLGKGKEYFIEGIFLQSNLKNRNGRVYPTEILDKVLSLLHTSEIRTSTRTYACALKS